MARPLVILSLLVACAWSQDADAQVNKCVGPDGRPLYTDQKCEALGATAAKPAASPSSNTATNDARLYRGGCTRTLQDLVFEITTAIDGHDANRLSNLYHWVGASTASANAVMDRLEKIASRPLLDIAPVQAAVAADTTVTTADAPRTTVRRPPVGLRLEQTLANGITPAPTIFGLRRHYGCWWIAL